MPAILHRRDQRWETERVFAPVGLLSLDPVRFEPAGSGHDKPRVALLLACAGADGHWVLLGRDDHRLLHNGAPVAAGIRVLAHRDALALDGGEAVYFSTEEAARVEPFAGPARVTCARCRGEILPGEAVVKCPGCGVFHHEIEERNCWTYANTCSLCTTPTALDGALQWTPETL